MADKRRGSGLVARGSERGATPREPNPGEPVSELLPPRPTLAVVRAIAKGYKACDLYKRGTQTVFGEGPAKAEIHPARAG